MLFGGNSGSCGGCGCKSCQECTRGCTEPHTGTAFETVYTLFFEGVEAGNPGGAGSGQALEATGDVDTSDPYDGMDGTTGPWEQVVFGTFTLSPSTTRFPCSVFIRFWRSHFALGAATVPPASDALTQKTIRITNEQSSEGDIVVVSGLIPFSEIGNTRIAPGTYLECEANDIVLVSGAGDQSDQPLRRSLSSVHIYPACGNHTVVFSVSLAIQWNTRARQHILYGRVQECYANEGTCADECQPNGNPSTTYLTFSNLSVSSPSGVTTDELNVLSTWLSGTYALDLVLASVCNWWTGSAYPAADWEGNFAFDAVPNGFILLGGLRDRAFRYERFSESFNWSIAIRDTNRTGNSCLNNGWSGTANVLYYGNTPTETVGTVDFSIT